MGTIERFEPRRLGRFAYVGAVGAVVDNAALVCLVELAGVAPVAGATIAKEAAIVVMFLLNDRWTFARFGRATTRAAIGRFLRSNCARAVGAGVGIATLAVLYHGLGVWYLPGNVVGICVGFVANFLLERHVTWGITTVEG